MRRWYLIVFYCLLPTLSVFAQNIYDPHFEALGECGHDPAALRDAIEADGWVFDDLIRINWSSGCRYLSMRLPSRYGDPGTVIAWDAITNTRVGALETYASGNAAIAYWDESGEYLMVPANNVGTYLWHVPSNRQMLLNTFECGLMNTYWDYERNLLYATSPVEWSDNWCSPFINVGGLRIYDLNTGETLHNYPTSGYTLGYEFSEDGRYIILSAYQGPVQIIDRQSGAVVATVNVNEGGGVVHTSAQIELSPNGRYLAIGMGYLRIWDLATLPADLNEHQPVYRYEGPSERIREVRFIDNGTIETVTRNSAQRWDITTGAQLP